MGSQNIPIIRFEGFADEWRRCKLGDICSSFSYGLNAAAKAFDGKNKYIRITDIDEKTRLFVDSAITSPDIDLSNADFYRLQVGDIVFARTGASVGKSFIYKESDGVMYYAGFLIRVRVRPEYNVEFVFQNTLTGHYKNFIRLTSRRSGQPGVNAKEYSNFELMCPSHEEQTVLGTFFRSLDNLIILYQRKCDHLLNIKKSMLKKMFPQDGASVPAVRFAGYSDDWKQLKMGEIVDEYEDPVSTPNEGYTRLGIRSYAKGTFYSYVEKGNALETAQMHRVAAGNFIVNITFGWEHAVAITTDIDAGKLVSHRFPQFKFRDGFVPDFFKYVIIDEHFKHHLWISSPGGAGRNRVLNISEMLEYKMFFPCKEEQIQIANFFSNLDELIALQERKNKHLQNIKKACLERMFV